jgi:hypothetical protein
VETRLHIPDHSGLAIVIVALLAAAGFLLYVWRVRGAVGRRDQAALVALRLVAVLGVVVAFLQVSVRREEVVRRKSVVPVLVDESASMGVIGAAGRTRAEQVSRFFADHRGWIEDVERVHDVRYYAFSDRVRRVTRPAIETGWAPEGGATDLAGAIEAAARDAGPGEIGGVLLFTDGIDNGRLSHGAEPARGAAQAGHATLADLSGPVHAFVPEPAERVQDVSLSRVEGLGYLLARNLAEVRCEVRAAGYDAGELSVTVSSWGEELARASVAVSEAARGATVVLTFLPREPGRIVLDVAVSPLPGEATLLNNRHKVVVDVVRDRLRVLHVAGHPSWDERFLREYFQQRPDTEPISFHTLRAPDAPVATPDDETTLIPFPAEEIFVRRVDGFDLVVFQDYDLPEVDRDRFAQGVSRYVLDGGALLVFGGSFSLGTRGAWPARLDSVLPVSGPKSPGHGMVEGRFAAEVTPEGARHPATADPRIAELMERAPPLTAVNPVGGLDPGAAVLVRVSPEGAPPAARAPVVVASAAGRGRVAMVLTDTLWRWAFDPVYAALYRRVVDGLVGFATRDPSFSPVRVVASKPDVLPGGEQVVTLTAAPGVTDVEARVQSEVEPGRFADALPVETLAGEAGSRELRFDVGDAGAWRVVGSGTIGAARVESADWFVVGPSREEVERALGPANAAGAVAAATGGEVHSMDRPALDDIELRSEILARLGVGADEPVWNHPLVFAILLVALALEWFVERKIGYT